MGRGLLDFMGRGFSGVLEKGGFTSADPPPRRISAAVSESLLALCSAAMARSLGNPMPMSLSI